MEAVEVAERRGHFYPTYSVAPALLARDLTAAADSMVERRTVGAAAAGVWPAKAKMLALDWKDREVMVSHQVLTERRLCAVAAVVAAGTINLLEATAANQGLVMEEGALD
jgi:hypothetical protein